MRGWKLAAVAVALMVFVGLSIADNNVQDLGTYFKNAQTGAKTDANGNASTTESAPLSDQNLTFANIIVNSSLSPGSADSSAILDTHRMRLGTLLVKCTGLSITGADSLSGIRLAIQVRTHLNGGNDSTSTFAFYMGGQTALGAVTTVASQIDTLLTGQIQTAANLAANVNGAWSGEFTVVAAYNRNAIGTSALGSIGSRTFYYPNGLAIPLSGIFGRDIYSPYTSIRVRNLGSGPSTARSCAVTVSLVGTPL